MNYSKKIEIITAIAGIAGFIIMAGTASQMDFDVLITGEVKPMWSYIAPLMLGIGLMIPVSIVFKNDREEEKYNGED